MHPMRPVFSDRKNEFSRLLVQAWNAHPKKRLSTKRLLLLRTGEGKLIRMHHQQTTCEEQPALIYSTRSAVLCIARPHGRNALHSFLATPMLAWWSSATRRRFCLGKYASLHGPLNLCDAKRTLATASLITNTNRHIHVTRGIRG